MNERPDLNSFDCIVFDMDGTLALSKSPISKDMGIVIDKLLAIKKVAVISGGRWEQFEKQLIPFLSSEHLENLLILPTSGTTMYRYENSKWAQKYNEIIPLVERVRIIDELKNVLARVGYHEPEIFGKIIEDRFCQITFSALGQEAPPDKKDKWDKDQMKRQMIVSVLRDRLPDYTLTIGGTTSIDITPKGVDKGYGIQKISETLGISVDRMIFVGDKLDLGGNDYPVKRTGVRTIAVPNEFETKAMLESSLI